MNGSNGQSEPDKCQSRPVLPQEFGHCRSSEGRLHSKSLLSAIAVVTQQFDRLAKRGLDQVRIEPTCRRPMTVQGFGPVTALAFRAPIDRPDRFRRLHEVGAYLGLTPRRYQSAVMGSLEPRYTKPPIRC